MTMNLVASTALLAAVSLTTWVGEAAAQNRNGRVNAWLSQQLSNPPRYTGYQQYTGGVGVRQAVRNPVGAYAKWSWNNTRSITSAGNAYAMMHKRRYYGQSPFGWSR